MYSRSYAAGLIERLHPLDKDVGTYEIEFAWSVPV